MIATPAGQVLYATGEAVSGFENNGEARCARGLDMVVYCGGRQGPRVGLDYRQVGGVGVERHSRGTSAAVGRSLNHPSDHGIRALPSSRHSLLSSAGATAMRLRRAVELAVTASLSSKAVARGPGEYISAGVDFRYPAHRDAFCHDRRRAALSLPVVSTPPIPSGVIVAGSWLTMIRPSQVRTMASGEDGIRHRKVSTGRS